MNVLVTGCGGDIGLGIGKILRKNTFTTKIIGCDIHEAHTGKKYFDICEVIDKVDSKNYLNKLESIVEKRSIDLIIPTSEAELRYFNQHQIEKINVTPIMLANKKSLTVGFDKLVTVNFLKSIGLPYPWTKVVKEGLPNGFPCIVKGRRGAGSKDVILVEDDELYKYFLIKRPNDIVQEYLYQDNEEYTCGLYRSRDGEIRTIIIRRKLKGGFTVYGEVFENKKIESVLIKLANELNLLGSINVQLRLTDRGPVIFEINPRFSSTVVFRHLIGFKDVVWCIEEFLGKKISEYIPPSPGTKFYRISEEVIDKIDPKN